MYPYPSVGSVCKTAIYPYKSFTRLTPCDPGTTVAFASGSQSILGLDGFGHRSSIVKSNFIDPTAYSVYWSEVMRHGAAIGSSNVACYPSGSPTFVYYRSGSNQAIDDFTRIVPRFLRYMRPNQGSPLSSAGVASPLNPLLVSGINNLVTGNNNEILLKLADQTNTLAVTIAESAKTSRYLLVKAVSLGQFLTGLRNSKKNFYRWLKRNYRRLFQRGSPQYRRAQSQLKRRPWDARLGSRWLEFNYAVMPLYYDIDGLIRFHEPKPLVFSVKHRSKTDINHLYKSGSHQNLMQVHVKVLSQHNVAISDPFTFAMNRLGLTPSQILIGLPWELLKFSFLLDWFLKINDLLKGMHAYQGVSFRSGYHSISFKGVERWSSLPPIGFDDLENRPIIPDLVVMTQKLSSAANNIKSVNFVDMKFSGFNRILIPKPARYSYFASLLNVKGTAARLLTLTSLAAVLRRP